MRLWLISAVLAFVAGCGRADDQKAPAPAVKGDPTATKLRRGLTTADVERIMGAPESVSTGSLWHYAGDHCVPDQGYPKGTCVVGFGLLDGLLVTVDGVAGAWIDLARF